jgi:Uma2 family endonuclease
MLKIKPRFTSFGIYELFNGELIEMPPESGLNIQIANRLFLIFALMLGSDRVRGQGLEIEVRGEPKNRYPDLTILREEHIQLLSSRNTIRLFMPPPLLVIEVVSPGEIQRERDYIAKRVQYQDCAIPEYWIVDPQIATIIVLELENSIYTEVGNFSQEDCLQSPGFPQLNFPVSQIFNPK